MSATAPVMFVTKPGLPRIAFTAPAAEMNARIFAYVAVAES
jgi:hypothetical protein